MYNYDLYLSIGSACRPAFHLKISDLRNEAYPLDWQWGYSLDTVIHLFKTKFLDFFVNIEEENDEWQGKHRQIRDVSNNIVSIHHFSREVEVEKEQKEFLKKMNKRFRNLDSKLENAKRVVLICNRNDSIEKLEFFLKEFSLIYPHLEIKLINIRNNEKMELNEYDTKRYMLSDYLSIEEYSFNDSFNGFTYEKADWRGNMKIWGDILKKYNNNHSNIEIIKQLKAEDRAVVIYGAGKRFFDIMHGAMYMAKLDSKG